MSVASFAALGLLAVGYVPEPVPLKTDIEVHAFYYPGTEQRCEWDLVEQTMPWIKPTLGWYDEGNPEVVDWQIKWAVEHGISAFAVDWYWRKGVQRLDHWVKAYYRARYSKYLKWYLMYANHNDPGAHSTADTKQLVKFWCDNYFKTPQYYRIDGKPLLVLWDYRTLGDDFAAEAKTQGEEISQMEGVRRALALMREIARREGVSDLVFMDVYHTWQDCIPAGSLKAAGYGAQTLYGFDTFGFDYGADLVKDGDVRERFDYGSLRPSVRRWWHQSCAEGAALPFWPFIPTGWDCRPRNFQTPRTITYGRTPEKFRGILEDARDFCREKGLKRIMIGPINEWQEGSYIEPNEEYGFGFYDAIREVFAVKPETGWPINITPRDIGLGPYDYSPSERFALTCWDFRQGGVLGWCRNPYGTAVIRNVDGVLHYIRANSPYGAIRTRVKPFHARNFIRMKVRMRIDEGNLPSSVYEKRMRRGFLQWGTMERPLIHSDRDRNRVSLDTSRRVYFETVADGAWHDYEISLEGAPGWEGSVDELWFDADNTRFSRVGIESIEFLPRGGGRGIADGRRLRDIPYDVTIGNAGLGDLYLPEKVDANTPVVLCIHGGAWTSGNRETWRGVAEYFSKGLGFAAFNIEYRLASQSNRWPACGNDCVQAAYFLLSDDFRMRYGLSHRKIWICGGSAGGHLALWTGLSLSPDEIFGIVSISGIGDPVPDAALHPSRYCHLQSTDGSLDCLDPQRLIKRGGPRILFTHADGDRVVPIASARNFEQRYIAAGNNCEFFSYPTNVVNGLTGHCIWQPESEPHRLIWILEQRIRDFVAQ